jgi:hypothetical protein
MKSSRSAQSESVPVKKTAKKTATPSAGRQKTSKVNQISKEEVARRAYFISERRRSLGMEGDEESDWVQAERELSEERLSEAA